MADWANGQVGLHFIPPGPWRNGCVESFNSGIRDECLNINSFWSLAHAPVRHRSSNARARPIVTAKYERASSALNESGDKTTGGSSRPAGGRADERSSGLWARATKVIDDRNAHLHGADAPLPVPLKEMAASWDTRGGGPASASAIE